MVNFSEKADTGTLYQIASMSNPVNVVLRTCNTDVLCITLGFRNQLSHDHHIWLEVGHQTNNTLRYIDDYLLCASLQDLIILSVFSKEGKVKPLKLLQDNVDFQNAFSALGSEDEIESFVCLWYSQTKLAEARLNSFLKSYKTKKNDFQSNNGCDASLMPLCGTVLWEKIKHPNFVISIWKKCPIIDSTEYF